MKRDPVWAVTEDRLRREADSLGALLEALRSQISPALVGGGGWRGLVERARDLPASFAAFPFGFELPLEAARPDADLGVSLVAGSRSAALFEARSRGAEAEPAERGIAGLLRAKSREDSPLRRVTGPKMVLEYDVARGEGAPHPGAGVFLYPVEGRLTAGGGAGGARDLAVVLDALDAGLGRNPDPAERACAQRAISALQADTRILSIGAFPSRARAVRLAATGFTREREVVEFLGRVGWERETATIAGLLSRFARSEAFARSAVHLDLGADGPGPNLGLGLFSKNVHRLHDGRYWMDRPADWLPLVGVLRDAGLGVEAKLAALSGGASGAKLLFGRTGRFVLLRGLHHLKLVISGGRVAQAKAYVFLVLCTPPE